MCENPDDDKAPIRLNPEPARELTLRECVKTLGGLIGGLSAGWTDPAVVRDAVRWWAENDEAWRQIKGADAMQRMMMAQAEAEQADRS